MKRIKTENGVTQSLFHRSERHSLFLLYTDRGGITSVKVWRVIKKNRNSINLSIELPLELPSRLVAFLLFSFFLSSFDQVWTMKASLGCRGISLKSESICLITGYVVVLLGFRFLLLFLLLLLLAFYALHQPRVSEIIYIYIVFIHLVFFFFCSILFVELIHFLTFCFRFRETFGKILILAWDYFPARFVSKAILKARSIKKNHLGNLNRLKSSSSWSC